MQSKKETYSANLTNIGVGLAFHVAPSNVPINFAFSFAFSLLAGNANIVRIPSREFPQMVLLCEIIKDTLEDPIFEDIRSSTSFISYPVDNALSESFSKIADARVLWGSDQTVRSLKSLGAKLTVRDMIFSDRYSMAIINSDLIINLDQEALEGLAKKFFNDTYLMDQNACSSPSLICWTGNNDKQARAIFWKAVSDSLDTYDIQTIQVVDKFTKLCADAVQLPVIKAELHDRNLTWVELQKNKGLDKVELKGSSGYFYELVLDKLIDVLPYITDKCQTLTYLGQEPKDLRQFVIDQNLRGIDRIVPVGSALDINLVWDGSDFIHTLSRSISIS